MIEIRGNLLEFTEPHCLAPQIHRSDYVKQGQTRGALMKARETNLSTLSTDFAPMTFSAFIVNLNHMENAKC